MHRPAEASEMKSARVTRQDAIRAYRVILQGRASGDEGNHFITFFNALIMHRWSRAGLRYIKEQAWKLQEARRE